MRLITTSITVFQLLALTWAAPAGKSSPKKEARDWFEKFGSVIGSQPAAPWGDTPGKTNGDDDIFSGIKSSEDTDKTGNLVGAVPPSGRASSPDNQGGLVSKLVKKDVLDSIAGLLHLPPPTVPWSAPENFEQQVGSILERMGLLGDALLDHLSAGANDLGQGLAFAKAKELGRILVNSVPIFTRKEESVKSKIGGNSHYTPKNLMDVLDKAQGAKADISGSAICPDGTEYKQKYVMASWELANLPEFMDNWPQVFLNTKKSDGKGGQVFAGASDDLMQNPFVDDYLSTNKLGKHFVVIDTNSDFIGVVQDNGNQDFEKCMFQ